MTSLCERDWRFAEEEDDRFDPTANWAATENSPDLAINVDENGF